MTRPAGFFPATGMPDRDWWEKLWPDPAATLKSLGVDAHKTVLDLCCGDGYFTAALATLTKGRVYGVDIDPDMLEQTRAAVAKAGATVLGLIEADARDLPTVLAEPMDFVLIANTFHGVPDQDAMSRSVAKTLRRGGKFAIVNWHQTPREETVVLGSPRGPATEMRMSPAQVRKVVESAGFEHSDTVELPPYHYGAVFRLQ